MDAMDFTWTAEQDELRAEARRVADAAVERYGRQNDSWINGFSKEFARNWRHGMDRDDVAGGVRGRRAAGDRPADHGEELISAGARSRRCGSPIARWARR